MAIVEIPAIFRKEGKGCRVGRPSHPALVNLRVGEMAKVAGTHPGSLVRYFQGEQDLKVGHLVRLAKRLGWSVESTLAWLEGIRRVVKRTKRRVKE